MKNFKIMKTIYNTVLIAFAALIFVQLSACQPDEFLEIGDPVDRIAQMEGTWVITSVTQIDDDATRKGFPAFATQQDITQSFPFTQFRVQLELNGSGNPAGFTVSPGDSPNLLGTMTSGNWSVDNLDFPSRIIFRGGGGAAATLDLASLRDLYNNGLTLRTRRFEVRQGKLQPFVTYNYTFTKAN
jgi:hypothetical protein